MFLPGFGHVNDISGAALQMFECAQEYNGNARLRENTRTSDPDTNADEFFELSATLARALNKGTL